MNQTPEQRKDILLRAAFDLLKRNAEGPYVKSAEETLVFYDGTNCDGHCLMNDIADSLEIDEDTKPFPLGKED